VVLSLLSLCRRLLFLILGELLLMLGLGRLAVLVEELSAVLVHPGGLVVDGGCPQVGSDLPVHVVLVLALGLAHLPSVAPGRGPSLAR